MRLWGENDFETLIVGLEPWVEQALIPAFQPLMMTIALVNRKTTAEELIGWSIEAIPAMALSALSFLIMLHLLLDKSAKAMSNMVV